MQSVLNRIYPMVLHFFAKGWSDDLDISFKKAVMNDVKNFQTRLILIPTCFVLAMVTGVAALVFLLYGSANLMVASFDAAYVPLITGGLLAMIAIAAGTVFYLNVRFLLRRVEYVQTSMIKAREVRPLHQLYQQIKEEQNMLLEAFLKNKQQKEYV